jgi:hypothetical protein
MRILLLAEMNLVDAVFGCRVSRVMRCSRCSHTLTAPTTALLHNLSLQETMPGDLMLTIKCCLQMLLMHMMYENFLSLVP